MLSFGVTVLPDPPWHRLVELIQLAEQNGFDYGWTYDSHVLRQEPYPLLTLAARGTERIKLGLNVTNPATREPTVTASAFATLQDVSGGRMVMGIGRGDSARRDIGQKPVNVAEFEAACRMMRDLMNGRPVNWNDTEIELQWVGGLAEIPLYIAGYGPKVLAIAGCVADGVIVQVADPEIVEWIVGQVRPLGRGGWSRPVRGKGDERTPRLPARDPPRRGAGEHIRSCRPSTPACSRSGARCAGVGPARQAHTQLVPRTPAYASARWPSDVLAPLTCCRGFVSSLLGTRAR